MEKRTKIILIILGIIILGYILYPKNIGFIERQSLNDEEIILGQYSQCLGIKLSEEVDNRTNFRCIGIPFGRITI